MTIQLMLEQLFEAGLSQTEIADRCGSTQPTICRAAKGASVRYEIGKAIEALHHESSAANQFESENTEALLTLSATLDPQPAAHKSGASSEFLSSTQQAAP